MFSVIFSFLDVVSLSKYRKCSKIIKQIIERETPCAFNINKRKFPDFGMFNYETVFIFNELQLFNFLGNRNKFTLLKHIIIIYKIDDYLCYQLEKLKDIKGFCELSCNFTNIKDFGWLDHLIQTSAFYKLGIMNLTLKGGKKQFEIFQSILKKRKKWEILKMMNVKFPSFDFLRHLHINKFIGVRIHHNKKKNNIIKALISIPTINSIVIEDMSMDYDMFQDLTEKFLIVKKISYLKLVEIKLVNLETIPNIMIFIQQLHQLKDIYKDRFKVKFSNEYAIKKKMSVNKGLF